MTSFTRQIKFKATSEAQAQGYMVRVALDDALQAGVINQSYHTRCMNGHIKRMSIINFLESKDLPATYKVSIPKENCYILEVKDKRD